MNGLPHATRADEAILVLHHPVLLGTDEDLRAIREAINVGELLRDSD